MHVFRFLLLAALLGLAGCGGAQMHTRDPNLVTLDGALGNRYVPAGHESPLVARIRIATNPVDPSHHAPINVALVVDTSGSMEGRPIEDARAASLALLDSLGPDDRLSVVVFHSRSEVLVHSTTLDGSARAEARTRIGAMRAQGTTDMANGLRLGLLEVMSHFVEAGINRVVLLSDGVPNDPATIEAMATSAGARGVSITALGLGPDYNETLMGAIAERSHGRFHYVADSSQVAAVFRDEVLRIQRVVARNAVAVLTPGPGIQIESVVGRASATRQGQEIRVPIGDISEGESRDLIVRLTAGRHRNGAPVEVMDVALAFDDAMGAAGHLDRQVYLSAHATTDDAQLSSGRNEDVERAAARIQLAAGTVAAIGEARSGNVAQAQADLDRALDAARADARRTNDHALEEQVSSVSSLRGALSSVQYSADSPPPAPSPVDYAVGEVAARETVARHRPATTAPAAAAPAEAPQMVRQAHSDAMLMINGN